MPDLNTSTFIDRVFDCLDPWVPPMAVIVSKVGMIEVEARDLKASGEGVIYIRTAPREGVLSSRVAVDNIFSVEIVVAKVLPGYDYAQFQPWVDFVDAMIEKLKETKFHQVAFDPYASAAEPIQKNLFFSETTLGFLVTQ